MGLKWDFTPTNNAVATAIKQVKFARMLAMNETVKIVKSGLRDEMKRVFRNPSDFTLNSMFIKPATKDQDNPIAELSFKQWAGKGSAANAYLYPQIYGGERRLKRMELWLRSKGVLPRNMFVVPGMGSKRDRYGNISSGQITQILSILQALPDSYQNTTVRSRRRNKALPNLFYLQKYGRLPAGIYQRIGTKNITPLLIFISQPHYRIRFRMQEVSTQIFNDNIQKIFEEKLNYAKQTEK
jgi:hypothetical protein